MTRKKPQLSIPTCVSVAAIVSAPSAQSLITQSVRINDSAQRVPTGLIAEMNKIDQHYVTATGDEHVYLQSHWGSGVTLTSDTLYEE